MKITLPQIPPEERTPLVEDLLTIIERLLSTLSLQSEEIQRLKDDIAILKNEKKRPEFKASKLDSETEKKRGRDTESKNKGKRPGSSKRRKNQHLVISEERIIAPAHPPPEGSRFKGYRDFIVQELDIRVLVVRYRLERWETPSGEVLSGRLPSSLKGRHYGPMLVNHLRYQHHHCQVTQPLALEQLREWGVDISSGEVDRLLSQDIEPYHAEKDALLKAGLEVSKYVTVDDTGARHRGKNGYVTHIGNDYFAWFASTDSKSRLNFLTLLRAGHLDYCVNECALIYMQQQALPQEILQLLSNSPAHAFHSEAAWDKHLAALGINKERHRRIATEGALLGCVIQEGHCRDLAIISDDAGQFNVFLHGLCWIHAERLIHKMIPLNEWHREDIAKVRDQIWTLYADLKTYKENPQPALAQDIADRFDAIFQQKTRYETLNQALIRIHKNKSELLLVLKRPEVPLHTNGSEGDIRDYVKKKKVSGGTRSDEGRRCRDTFASLKKTCRKLGISFWKYLIDRSLELGNIPPLPIAVRQAALA